jgi:hypothetical protein
MATFKKQPELYGKIRKTITQLTLHSNILALPVLPELVRHNKVKVKLINIVQQAPWTTLMTLTLTFLLISGSIISLNSLSQKI